MQQESKTSLHMPLTQLTSLLTQEICSQNIAAVTRAELLLYKYFIIEKQKVDLQLVKKKLDEQENYIKHYPANLGNMSKNIYLFLLIPTLKADFDVASELFSFFFSFLFLCC